MNSDTLLFINWPKVSMGSNTFIDVPVILKYDNLNMIEIIKEPGFGYTTQIPIFDAEGTYLATAKGSSLITTDESEIGDLKLDHNQDSTTCTLDGKTLFTITRNDGDSFNIKAELFTPEGYCVKYISDETPELFDKQGYEVRLGGVLKDESVIEGCDVGFWLTQNGTCRFGVNEE